MKSINVIVLDDEQYILNSINRLFRDEDFGVFCTTEHKECLKIMEKEKIKVVMSDHKMPNILGLDFLESIEKKYPKVVRILFTGYSNLQIVKDALTKGKVAIIIDKPWNDKEVKRIVRKAIKQFDTSK
ncbi:MAG: response regulator [Candidatus Omnitrophica bacterium]|jgi:DNA-binding NtrC family response regulator|nr:response regulator [Candidatus Omnitrophota bacterium]